jgi:predicted AAA+ superfamily ATPase
MKYKSRLLTGRLKRMLERFPVVVVCGARQVGKSTLLQHALPKWDMVVFDPAVDVENAREDPDLFLDNHPTPVILDEIQFAPELVAAIKRRVDRSRQPGQYVLTGSQQWAVLQSASESLAGRAVFLDLEGFSLSEIAEDLTDDHWLKRYLDHPDSLGNGSSARLKLPRTVFKQLWWGSLPEADFLEKDLIGEFYRAYLRTYIERDVRMMSDVSDWQQFGRFVRLAAALTAQEVNYSQFGRDISVTPQTARRWLATLQSTFQWFEVPSYHGNTVKRISGKSKGYVADTGLACSLQMISTPQTLGGHPLAGAMFETLVVSEIRKLSRTLDTPPSLYHWRSHGGGEVDLLLERDGRMYPIEIKLTSKPSKADTRGICSLRETYPQLDISPGLVICPCQSVWRLNETDFCLPWDLR